MLINIANIPIEIQNGLLCPQTLDYLNPFEVISSVTVTEEPFKVVTVDKTYFSNSTSITKRFESSHYQEFDSVIIVDDDFSYFKIDMKERIMQICPKKDTYLQSPGFLTDLKILLSLLAIDKGGILLHSSALSCSTVSLLFTGRSGAGKSTIAQLLRPHFSLINDEYNILIPQNSNVQVFTTPYGKIKNDEHYHPSAQVLFFINQSTTNRTCKITMKEAIRLLIGNVCTLPCSDYFGTKLLENFKNCIDKVSVNELYFKNDASLLDFIISMDILNDKL